MDILYNNVSFFTFYFNSEFCQKKIECFLVKQNIKIRVRFNYFLFITNFKIYQNHKSFEINNSRKKNFYESVLKIIVKKSSTNSVICGDNGNLLASNESYKYSIKQKTEKVITKCIHYKNNNLYRVSSRNIF